MAKPALSIGYQIDLLVQRGLPVPLPADADFHERESEYRAVVRLLIDNNYYRLSGYWRYFQVNPGRGDNRFTATGTVAQIETVYTFDHGLRSILLEGLAALEVTFRSRFAYYAAANLPGDCYVDRTSFINRCGQNGRELRDVLIVDWRATTFVDSHRSGMIVYEEKTSYGFNASEVHT
jgi:abortive infection bacteriophage resistance protein